MNSDKLVSIIIPVFNGEKYIKQCVASLIEQTYTDIEIIVVNDGSTDKSADIVEEIAKTDNRVRLINKENGGVSSSRNRGIDEANGEYIAFCDADDEYYPDAVSELVSLFDNNTDLAVGSHIKEWIKPHSCAYTPCELTKEDLKSDFLINSDYFHFIWGNIYSAEIIKTNSIRFNEELSFSEDFDFNLRYIKCCEKTLKVSDKIVYHYYISRSGAHEKRDYPVNDIETVLRFFDGRENIDKAQYNEIVSYYLTRCIHRTYSWYNVSETARLVRIAYKECEEYITDEILENTFGKEQLSLIKDDNYNAFIKNYISENKGMIYDKYRYFFSKAALKILKGKR